VGRQVRLLDGVNLLAFRDQPELLAAWHSVSRVRATPAPAEVEDQPGDAAAGSMPPVPGGDVRPAA
jgi:hypothetical protein